MFGLHNDSSGQVGVGALGTAAIAAVISAVICIIGVKIFTSVNTAIAIGGAAGSLLDLTPLLLAALVLIGIVILVGSLAR